MGGDQIVKNKDLTPDSAICEDAGIRFAHEGVINIRSRCVGLQWIVKPIPVPE